MPGVESGFWDEHGPEISAAITLAVTIAVALIVDRLVLARANRVADRFAESGVSLRIRLPHLRCARGWPMSAGNDRA